MSSLRARLGKVVTARRYEVVDGDDVYDVAGLPSAGPLLASFNDEENTKLANLWNVQFPVVDEGGVKIAHAAPLFTTDAIGNIRIVHAFTRATKDEAPYELSEIAELFATDGLLFVRLLGAAMKCMNRSDVGVVEIETKNS